MTGIVPRSAAAVGRTARNAKSAIAPFRNARFISCPRRHPQLPAIQVRFASTPVLLPRLCDGFATIFHATKRRHQEPTKRSNAPCRCKAHLNALAFWMDGAQERIGSPPARKFEFPRVLNRPGNICVPVSCTVFKLAADGVAAQNHRHGERRTTQPGHGLLLRGRTSSRSWRYVVSSGALARLHDTQLPGSRTCLPAERRGCLRSRLRRPLYPNGDQIQQHSETTRCARSRINFCTQ